MTAKISKAHWAAFTAHTLRALPDSIRERKVILTCLLQALPADSRTEVSNLLHQLRSHEVMLARLQAELPLAFKNEGGQS